MSVLFMGGAQAATLAISPSGTATISSRDATVSFFGEFILPPALPETNINSPSSDASSASTSPILDPFSSDPTAKTSKGTGDGGGLGSGPAELPPGGFSAVPLPPALPMFAASLLVLAGFGYRLRRGKPHRAH